ncbi:MAG: glycosyltransferase family 2 protein [Acidobacteria bacterium]|nr:glycosyltransferase family 2 protein [Acidobacteriota bacterium]
MSPSSPPAAPVYSVVVPFYNEAEAAALLIAEIERAMQSLGEPWELLMVNDGSRDATGEILQQAAGSHANYRHLRLPKNRGQAAALAVGLERARGRFVVTLDGDGQNDPADIPALLPLLDSADMVVGIRGGRRDSWLRRAMSKFANAIRGRLLDDRMQDSGCALKVFRREIVPVLLPLKTLYSFMPAMAKAGGFRLAELPVNHRPRQGGTSSYGFVAFLWKPAVDLVGVWWFRKRSFALRGVEVEELDEGIRRAGPAGTEPSPRRPPGP